MANDRVGSETWVKGQAQYLTTFDIKVTGQAGPTIPESFSLLKEAEECLSREWILR